MTKYNIGDENVESFFEELSELLVLLMRNRYPYLVDVQEWIRPVKYGQVRFSIELNNGKVKEIVADTSISKRYLP